jgi:hypothetical protein
MDSPLPDSSRTGAHQISRKSDVKPVRIYGDVARSAASLRSLLLPLPDLQLWQNRHADGQSKRIMIEQAGPGVQRLNYSIDRCFLQIP